MRQRFLNLLILFIIICLPLSAKELKQLDYKNIKNEAKISFLNDIWSDKVEKKQKDYFIKKSLGGFFNYSEYYSPEGKFLFSTGTQYEFVNNGSLIGYSNSDLKFYEFFIKDDLLQQRELTEAEINDLFPKYQIIKISDFKETNSVKVKKKTGKLKLILLNDTDRIFDNYGFTTHNSKLDYYLLKGVVDIKKRGMIQFSRFGENTKNYPWYVILVR